jgi:poly-beta-hydroxybutyrate-responsive repressor
MPRGRWREAWREGVTGGACPRRISRFLEPCLLLLLRDDASHGYDLVERLRQFGFAQGVMDISIVYRVLREMELRGWVTSEWDTAGSGPPRRVYNVTPDGAEYLHWWITDLRQTRDEIDRFLETYAQQEARRAPARAGEGTTDTSG